MKRYLGYLKYILKHKYYVMLECFKVRLIWRGIIHDWDKFLPSSFIAYAHFFHDKKGTNISKRDKTGYYKPTDTGNESFEKAWFMHTRKQNHHWQYWVLSTEDGEKFYKMDIESVLEMICDWRGAGKAQGSPDTKKWWETNKDKIKLHPDTRNIVEKIME